MGEVITVQPWLPQSFISTFSTWDTKDWKVWEFGSGLSTVWFAKRVQTLWSMEHSVTWHNAVVRGCDRKGVKNVHLMLEKLGGTYESKISTFQDRFFDFVLVDGCNRVKCFKAALPKTRKVIVLDNGLRDRYAAVREMMSTNSEWKMRIAKWVDPVVRDAIIVPPKASWHSLVWVRKGVKLK